MKNILISGAVIILSICILSACGGGSDRSPTSTDNSSNSDNTSSNDGLTAEQLSSQEIALSSIETTKSFLAGQNSPFTPTKSLDINQAPDQFIHQFVYALAASSQEKHASKTEESETTIENGDCGGTATTTETTITPDDPDERYPLEIRIDSDFSDYCLGDASHNATINGSLDFVLHYDSLGNGYQNLVYELDYSSNLPLGPYNGHLEYEEHCTITNSVATCAPTVNHSTSGGVSYTFTDIELTGDASSGYNMTGTLSNSTGGVYSIVVNNLTLCANGNLQTGTIDITDNSDNSVISLNVTSCEEVVVTYMGNSWTVQQPDS